LIPGQFLYFFLTCKKQDSSGCLVYLVFKEINSESPKSITPIIEII